ncbi:uncharacterized protein LOC135388910 [Ornithodoros turicata]|uniref:uncharacterized protein LOC135388910 n=1 Tax=Ornithodoros turicata TaxID=34597 RepID=UPI003139D723
MRLTSALLGIFRRRSFGGPRFHFVKHIPGKIDIGKVRVVPPVTGGTKLKIMHRLLLEEQNMMYLERPYLTPEEEKHLPPSGIRANGRHYRLINKKEAAPLKTLFAADLLAHLNTARQWEE